MTIPKHDEPGRLPAVARLDAYRAARLAATFMLGTFHDPPWMAGVRVEGDGEGEALLVVVLRWQTEMILRCLPTKVNGIPVVPRAEPAAGKAAAYPRPRSPGVEPRRRALAELRDHVDRLEPRLTKTRWSAMTYMGIPSLLAAADALLAEISGFEPTDDAERTAASALHTRLATLRAGFKRSP